MTNENKLQAPLVDGYEVVIGIEIHCQLNTNTKIFSSASTLFGQEPNTQANIVDLAMPGALPVLNKDVVEKANALRSQEEIDRMFSKFDLPVR